LIRSITDDEIRYARDSARNGKARPTANSAPPIGGPMTVEEKKRIWFWAAAEETCSAGTSCLINARPTGLERPRQAAEHIATASTTGMETPTVRMSVPKTASRTSRIKSHVISMRLRLNRSPRMPPGTAVSDAVTTWIAPIVPA
jgi:hypothetical protein